MVAVAEFTGICARCGGDQSSHVMRPERFACIYCGWREYGSNGLNTSGEGQILRLRYLGTSPTLMRLPPLVALMIPGVGTVAQPRLGLRIACPLCREGEALTTMTRCGRSLERWQCAVGHQVRLHRVGREEIVGWS